MAAISVANCYCHSVLLLHRNLLRKYLCTGESIAKMLCKFGLISQNQYWKRSKSVWKFGAFLGPFLANISRSVCLCAMNVAQLYWPFLSQYLTDDCKDFGEKSSVENGFLGVWGGVFEPHALKCGWLFVLDHSCAWMQACSKLQMQNPDEQPASDELYAW